VRNTLLGVGVVGLAVCAVAWMAGAQRPPRIEFGRRGPGPSGPPDGMFSLEGLMGGFGSATVTGMPFQFTFTISRTEPVLVNGNASIVTSTTTGIIARSNEGSTYRNSKFSQIGPWASSGQPREFTIIRNIPSMMEYIIDVGKASYRSFPVRQRDSKPRDGAERFRDDRGPGKAPDASGSGNGRTRTTIANYAISDGSYTCPNAEKTSVTRTIQLAGTGGSANITRNRVYCTDLKLVVEEGRSDPRFGNTTYQLSGYLSSPKVFFTPDPTFKEQQGGKSHGGAHDGDKHDAPPPPPQD
jgi:hypothetical protein